MENVKMNTKFDVNYKVRTSLGNVGTITEILPSMFGVRYIVDNDMGNKFYEEELNLYTVRQKGKDVPVKVATRKEAIEMMKNTNGRLFSVKFTKKDDSLRAMTCRLGVTKNVNGNGRKGWKEGNTEDSYGLLSVFDINVLNEEKQRVGGHRFVNLDTLKEVKVNGTIYNIV